MNARCCVLFLFVAAPTSLATADEPPAARAGEQVPAHRVVLRLSEGMLNSLWGNQWIDRQADVRDNILGTSIYGRARVVGASRVQLAESPDQARFQMLFQGTAYSRTTGYNGPAIIYSRAVTAFTATKQIVAEAGDGFRAWPSQVWARTQTFVEGIGSTRGGLVGRIVQRRAARSEAELHAEATEIARQKTARRVGV